MIGWNCFQNRGNFIADRDERRAT